MRDESSGISFPDFATLTVSHGIRALDVEESWHVPGAVAETLKGDDPCLCEVWMDPDQPQIPKSINRRLADGTIQQTALEDAWPYLPAEEVQENLRT